ncbi:uncharacterized protein N7503_006159 [Penicillium pulvis]|uniref:uncharacterized protein n=1 Tax=Penicillium pulvis TaxID=1562058 RepID=UPI00254975B2|nr:uncharacterized protein N7503_006159 [Penicillium pulvis]KAJ5798654.1 hypothetical protein N7503_006159 [Penicillium pulvis]
MDVVIESLGAENDEAARDEEPIGSTIKDEEEGAVATAEEEEGTTRPLGDLGITATVVGLDTGTVDMKNVCWLEGDSAAPLDAIGVEEALGIVVVAEADGDYIGVDYGLTEREPTAEELGMAGQLGRDDVATLDNTGKDEALGVVFLAETDENGVGIEDGFTEGELAV